MPVAVETKRQAGVDQSYWYAGWTNSRCEQLVFDQWRARGFDPFLPRINQWARAGRERQVATTPLFTGYLFLRHGAMTPSTYREIRKARGLVKVLGERWDRLAIVPDDEMEAIRRVQDSRVPVMPHPYLRDGERVRIIAGPLTDVEGVLVRTKPTRGLVVLSVQLVQGSIAVEVDCTSVAPVGR